MWMQIKQHSQQTNKIIRKDCHFFWTYITVHNDSLQIISNTLFCNFTVRLPFSLILSKTANWSGENFQLVLLHLISNLGKFTSLNVNLQTFLYVNMTILHYTSYYDYSVIYSFVLCISYKPKFSKNLKKKI